MALSRHLQLASRPVLASRRWVVGLLLCAAVGACGEPTDDEGDAFDVVEAHDIGDREPAGRDAGPASSDAGAGDATISASR